MSRLFEALQQSGAVGPMTEAPDALEVLDSLAGSLVDEDSKAISLPHTPERRLVAAEYVPSLGAEKFRQLATRLKYAQERLLFKKVLITSCMRGEGKSLISANLAISLARNNQRVLLIDGDLRQPRLNYLFDLHGAEGIAEWAPRPDSAMSYLQRVQGLPLWILPAGQDLVNAFATLKPQRVAELLAEVESSFEWVVIDAPPVIAFAESLMWAAACERVLMVVREGITSKRLLNRALEAIEKPKVLGAILNDTSEPEEKYYDRYYTDRAPGAISATGASGAAGE